MPETVRAGQKTEHPKRIILAHQRGGLSADSVEGGVGIIPYRDGQGADRFKLKFTMDF